MLALLLSFAFACDVNLIVCQTVCAQDGDDRGVLIDKKCYCANPRDTAKVIARVPKSYTKKDEPKKHWLDQ